MRVVLQIFREKQFHVNFRKCKLWLGEVRFLGNVILARGIRVGPSMIPSIIEWKLPTMNLSRLGGILQEIHKRILEDSPSYDQIATKKC
ncbi:RNA-directed DNA polymerase-like protein [Gossypium australe]|uniref:RNA-directed DNA polymerase-like protein n=1 Tax=Gossypium australe TaxID=47621 RepID=A0A5B6VPB4_9ROSI|nr:RNA-directed DNA polymerase-like protein [Gossypium australe]